jgi:hypothetical protein
VDVAAHVELALLKKEEKVFYKNARQQLRSRFLKNELKPFSFERHCHANENSQTIACARRCRSSRLTWWWTRKWKAEEEEGHMGSLIKKMSEA